MQDVFERAAASRPRHGSSMALAAAARLAAHAQAGASAGSRPSAGCAGRRQTASAAAQLTSFLLVV